MTIDTQLLKKFIKTAGCIKPSLSFPITDHILIGDGFIAKTNLVASCTMSAPVKDNILVEEKALSGVLDTTKAEQITIKQEGKKVIIDDGQPVSHPFTKPDTFPAIPKMTGDVYEISDQAKESLMTATRFISDNVNTGAWCNVHMKSDYIAATDGIKMFYETFKQKLPELVIAPEDIAMIYSLHQPVLSESDNHYFARSAGFTFSFTKIEDKTPDFKSLIKHRNEVAGEAFEIDKKTFISFCERVNRISDSKVSLCSISEAGLDLIDVDKSFHVDSETPIPLMLFRFNSRTILPAIKCIGDDVLKITRSNEAIMIAENNSLILFQGMQP